MSTVPPLGKAVCLLSGGLDSVVAAAHRVSMGHPVVGLFVRHGQRSERMELQACGRLAKHIGLDGFDVTDFNLYTTYMPQHLMFKRGLSLLQPPELDITPYEIPFRNGILMSLAVAYAKIIGAPTVFTGSKGGEVGTVCHDDSDQMLYHFSRSVELATKMDVQIQIPLQGWTKKQIYDRGVELGIPLELCWGCFGEGPLPCRECKRCRSYMSLGLY